MGVIILTKQLHPPQVVTLNKIQENFNDYQNQAFPKREPQFFALELAGECGELANLEKKMWRDSSLKLKENELEFEAADVFIALLNYCNSRSINLEEAVSKKLEIIESRRISGLMGKSK
jgi:NTP pyrophosphatase (non-canonical NTP hydrolase)